MARNRRKRRPALKKCANDFLNFASNVNKQVDESLTYAEENIDNFSVATVSTAYNQYAYVCGELGGKENLSQSLDYYYKALLAAEEAAKEYEDIDFREFRAIRYSNYADTLTLLGGIDHYNEAIVFYQKAIELREALFEDDKKERKDGILTLSNHIKNKENELHWITLPFEWNYHNTKWNGEIRVLINTILKSTEKIKIKCSNMCKKYSFMLYFKGSKVSEIRFCTLPPLLTSQISDEEKRLGEMFCSGMNDNSVAVIYSALAFD